ncbi:hydroxyisourate hydrolase [Chroococcidiopsis sp. TS-821]|uniref:hydroxyisourate hydrolase n=1 Tax=Chroococcidiopsis sp. TS-821 TaxID=1378066 RepID=UPI001AF00740|nr:hydroxyisourate hydrolase [Chroococcidiopsis sp. TS-821]
MAGGISIHVVDVTRGLPAAGMVVEIFKVGGDKIAAGVLSHQGVLDHSVVRGENVEPGNYEVVFHIGEFYHQLDYALSEEFPFLDVRFALALVTLSNIIIFHLNHLGVFRCFAVDS